MGRSCHNRRRGRRGLERTTATPIVHIVAIVIGHLVLPAAHLTRVHRTVQLAPPARHRRSSRHFGCCRRCRRCRQWPSVGARPHVQRQMESGAHQHYGGRAGLRFFSVGLADRYLISRCQRTAHTHKHREDSRYHCSAVGNRITRNVRTPRLAAQTVLATMRHNQRATNTGHRVDGDRPDTRIQVRCGMR